jgi:hypothetical protein
VAVDDNDDDAGKGDPGTTQPNDASRAQAGVTYLMVDSFAKDHGFEHLEQEDREIVNGALLSELADILDPQGNKSNIKEILKDVSPERLPKYLDKALYLAQKNPKVTEAFDKVKKKMSGNQGMLGSYAGGSVPTGDDVVLSDKEKEVARKMNIPEEKYLANKKKMLSLRNQPD